MSKSNNYGISPSEYNYLHDDPGQFGLNHRALMAAARRKQQDEQNERAAEYAVKQRQKDDEKRKKKIEQWERMQGRGVGHFLGGTADMRDGEARQEAVAAARDRMQENHNARVAHWVQNPPEQHVSTEQKLEEQRAAARRMKKIADWERVNKVGDGHRLDLRQPNLNAQGGGARSKSSNNAEQTQFANKEDDDRISEEMKREAMRVARLRMQQAHDQKVKQAQQSKE